MLKWVELNELLNPTLRRRTLQANSSLISENPLFENLSQSNLNDLTQAAIRKTYQAQEILVHQGDVWPYLFFVAAGEINARKESPEGRVFIATTLKSGDIFWGLAFFIEDASMPVMLQANSETELLIWSRGYLAPIFKGNGSMSWKLCQIMIDRMQQASVIVDDLAFHPVMSRLAGLLLDISGDSEKELLARELTLDEMAARIGTTREMVCRYLYRFAEKGAIDINRTEFKIKDRWLLEEQARR
jgi:CRP-like cAMP-binding protein